MRSWLLVVFGIILSGLIISALIYSQRVPTAPLQGESVTELNAAPAALHSQAPTPEASMSPGTVPGSHDGVGTPDLSTDVNGLSKTTVVISTSNGVIKFKFYPKDAPKTVKRMLELIQQGFYNGLTFHRVVPGFVVQGGDPLGNGTGGSGQKLDAEFNDRRHVEGAVAMARAADANSADSQFYISLGTHPHLDHKYTVFGQVIEGMSIAKSLKVGDKMIKVTLE